MSTADGGGGSAENNPNDGVITESNERAVSIMRELAKLSPTKQAQRLIEHIQVIQQVIIPFGFVLV